MNVFLRIVGIQDVVPSNASNGKVLDSKLEVPSSVSRFPAVVRFEVLTNHEAVASPDWHMRCNIQGPLFGL